MDTMYSNNDLALFATKQSKSIENRVKKYTTQLILSSITNETITDFNKLALNKNLNTHFVNTNNNFCGVSSDPIIYNDNSIRGKSNLNMEKNTTDNQTDNCKNIEIDDICIKTDNKNFHMKTTNKKQKNISFSNEKLWEINRVNQILHNKITNGVKPTYTSKKPSTSVKATSTINRERKNKVIVKENEVSFKYSKICIEKKNKLFLLYSCTFLIYLPLCFFFIITNFLTIIICYFF